MGSLVGAVAVITGSSRGIGRAIAEELSQSGAKVIVHNHQSRKAAEDVVAHLKQSGLESVAIQADVSDPAQATRLIDETLQRFGRMDVLVNNAAINIDRTMKNLSPVDWDTVIKADFSSYFYTVRATIPHFIQQKSGKIINISSMNAESGSFGQANYSAAKAGIIGFTKTAALELARYNVTVNAICPGYVATEMYEAIPAKTKEAILARIPLGRAGTPKEVARAVHYLIVDGDYYTGETLNMNGGAYMQ